MFITIYVVNVWAAFKA